MKALITLLIFIMSVGSLKAQQEKTPLFRIMKVGVQVGEDQDRILNMDHNSLIRMVDEPMTMELSDIDFTERDAYSMICENPHVRLDLSMIPRFAPRSEMRFSLLGMFNRIDAVSYSRFDGLESRDLTFEARSNELALETALLRKFEAGKFRFYLGGGTNLGYSFNNQVFVSGNNVRLRESGTVDDPVNYTNYDYFNETYTAGNALHQRVFAEAGISFVIAKRVELGIHYRYGLGYRWTQGSGSLLGTNFRSGGLSAKYLWK